MSISPFKTFAAGEVLTASDLNSSITQIINNPVDLWSPAAKAVDFNGNEIVLDADADSSMTADTDDRIDFKLQGKDLIKFDGTTASAQNGLTILCSAAGNAIQLQAQGDDTDISINIVPKNSGTVQNNGSTIGTLSNVVEDSTPQLGGQLDVNGNAIGDGTRELLTFTEDSDAVNHVSIENQAAGGGPIMSAAGDDTNINLVIQGKGTGTVDLGNASLSFPNADGTNGQAVVTNGSGALSFADLSGGKTNLLGSTFDATLASGTTIMPVDNTIPQNTEGVEFMTLAVTPDDSDSQLIVDVLAVLANDTRVNMNMALFVDSTADALMAVDEATGNNNWTLPLRHRVAAAGSGARTYKMRAGASGSGTTYFNGNNSGTQVFGGVSGSHMLVWEILP